MTGQLLAIGRNRIHTGSLATGRILWWIAERAGTIALEVVVSIHVLWMGVALLIRPDVVIQSYQHALGYVPLTVWVTLSLGLPIMTWVMLAWSRAEEGRGVRNGSRRWRVRLMALYVGYFVMLGSASSLAVGTAINGSANWTFALISLLAAMRLLAKP
jgi:hypothetical protein